MNEIDFYEDEELFYIIIPNNYSYNDLKEFNISKDYFIFKSEDLLERQKIYLVKGKYVITFSHNLIKLFDKTHNYLNKIIIDREKNSYYISSNDDKYCFSSNSSSNTLNKIDALYMARDILDNICSYPDINNSMFCYDPYSSLKIVPSRNYYPLISNDVITISWPYRYKETDINIQDRELLNIILNSTNEKIGDISFCFINYRKDGFTYDGNISYQIDDEFQNKGYATMALGLLKELLKDNKKIKNKNMFISTLPDNIFSQKVALNNGGKLIYSGLVPKDDSLYSIGGIEEVKIYQIKI